MNLVKSPHELLMEQAGLPSYAGGHSVSPEQMKVELMINGRKVHQADLPHDHPLIQHFADGKEVRPPIDLTRRYDPININLQEMRAKPLPPSSFEKFTSRLGSLLGHGATFGIPAYDVAEQLKNNNIGGARESTLDAVIGLAPMPVQAGWAVLRPTELNTGEDEVMKQIHQMQDQMLANRKVK